MNIWKSICAGCLTLLLVTPAYAQDGAGEGAEDAADAADVEADAEVTADAEGAADESDKDWGVSFKLGSSIGQGTFVNVDSEVSDPGCTLEDQLETGCIAEPNNAFDRAYLSYVLGGSYRVWEITFGAEFALIQWLTAGGGYNDAREVRWEDVGLDAGWDGYTIEGAGVNIAPSLSLSLPTSQISQFTTKIVGTSLGLAISKTFFEKMSLALSLGFGKTFHRFTAPAIDQEQLEREDVDEAQLAEQFEPEAAVFREGGSEDIGGQLVAVEGVNTEYAFSVGGSASLPVYEKLRLAASYGLITYWTYNRENDDELTPEVENVQTGRGIAQLTQAGVGLSYPISLGDFNLGLSAGVSTTQFPKTDDNNSFRFPFWNFQGAARNASALKFGVSMAY